MEAPGSGEELSVEQTNALRIKLGLAPLKLPTQTASRAAPSDAVNARASQALADKISRERRKRALQQRGPTLGDESLDSSLASATQASAAKRAKRSAPSTAVENHVALGGEVGVSGIMVLEDLNVLDGDKLADSEAKLVALETGGRLGPKPSAMGSDDADNNMGDDDDKPFVPEGAKLFVSSALERPASDFAAPRASKKPSKPVKKPVAAVAIPKIARRSNAKKTRVRIDEDDDAPSSAQPPSSAASAAATATGGYGGDSDNDEEEDMLEAALARARKTTQLSSETLAAQMSSLPSAQAAPMGDDEGEVLVLGTFKRVEAPSAAASATAPGDAAMDDGASTAMAATTTTTVAVDKPTTTPASATATSTAPTKAKPTHRSIADSLAAMYESGELAAQDEIVVGRQRDARQDQSVNRPGDLVKLEYRDDHGRLLTSKEAFRQQAYQMRGQTPSVRKREKREEELKRQQLLQVTKSGDTPLHMASAATKLLAKTGSAHVTLKRG